MNRKTREDEIARRLAELPSPEPPPDLLARIREDIPTFPRRSGVGLAAVLPFGRLGLVTSLAAHAAALALAAFGGWWLRGNTVPEPAPPAVPAPDLAVRGIPGAFHRTGSGETAGRFVDTASRAISEMPLDVEPVSLEALRSTLVAGRLPAGIAPETIVSAFDYGDRSPGGGAIALSAEGGPTPFARSSNVRLVRFGVRSGAAAADDTPATLTVVVDASRAMGGQLDHVRSALEDVASRLRPEDRLAVIEAGPRPSLLVAPTSDRAAVTSGVAALAARGDSDTAAGVGLGLDVARRNFRPGTRNRLVLCSSAEPRALARVASYVERVADPSIDVSALAFGDGTAAEASLEAIARAGGGSWGSVGSGSEARRALTEQLTGAPQTIAHDAQAQVAFNPDVVGRWRFVGLSDAGAAPWRPGAGEIGADTALAAVYEVELQPAAPRDAPLATLALSYRPAGAAGFTRTERELRIADLAPTWDGAPASLKLAALAARFADVLSGDAPVAAREALFREAQRQLPAFGGRSDVAGLVTLAGLAVHARTAAGNDDGVVAVAMGTASAPVLVERVDPVYPEAARRARFEGTVMLQALVGMDGRIEEVTVLRSVPPLDAAAVSAVRRWRYKPSMAGGQPVPAHVTVSVRFSM